ncbi:N-6 DNA methylase [Streptomyces sp. NBC_00247]|uniref:N-6 DNA methylase n=1 Tax=Streptomyces sp. NBC_00247 TaxID=2975689 RepID=UPI002E2A974A|nr:N-6 DNA methylase [Streptomyces sp. NBC_00247]
MSQPQGPPASVSLAEIARMVGVGRAAVSNWRRRHESFPAPLEGNDVSPQFDWAEVEAWLRAEGKLKAPVGALERLWPEFEALGGRDAMGCLVAAVGERLGRLQDGGLSVPVPLLELSAHQNRLLARVIEVAADEGSKPTFDFLYRRWLHTHVRQVTVTAKPLASLMAGIATTVHGAPVRSVLDPACGTGALLLATAHPDPGQVEPKLFGQDQDPVLAALAAARLAMAGRPAAVTVADSLRADALAEVRADLVLCNPPSNERDWGHAELATDTRWEYGLPPRTESELAWVQHTLAALAPGGTAVLVLPPGVAARRAGRRVRAGLLRAGALRAVIALPPGAAPPHGVGLHVWVLAAPDPKAVGPDLLLVDTVHGLDVSAVGKPVLDWARVENSALTALRGEQPAGSVSVPIIELLDDDVDLTPARHIPGATAASTVELRRGWTRFDMHLRHLQDVAGGLSTLSPTDGEGAGTPTTVAALERAGALKILTGQSLPEHLVRRGERPEDALAALTSLGLPPGAGYWLHGADAARGEADGSMTLTASQDVVVVGLARSFEVRVDDEAPSVLGSQLYALRADPALLDPWFLAGCLGAPANIRQAGTHASTSSRIDVRRLQVPRLPLREQQKYGEAHRRLVRFEREARALGCAAAELAQSLGDLIASGKLSVV